VELHPQCSIAYAVEVPLLYFRNQLAISTFFYELESNAIDSLKRQLLCPVFAFGPGIPFI
jgi:hypothetical protein